MLTLYYKPTCVFSNRVIETALALGLNLKLIDASFDEVVIKEMVRLGGKKSIPFLVNSEKNITMYDSNNIIEHLKRNFIGSNDGIEPVMAVNPAVSNS